VYYPFTLRCRKQLDPTSAKTAQLLGVRPIMGLCFCNPPPRDLYSDPLWGHSPKQFLIRRTLMKLSSNNRNSRRLYDLNVCSRSFELRSRSFKVTVGNKENAKCTKKHTHFSVVELAHIL